MKFFNYPMQVKRFDREDELRNYFAFRKQNDKTELMDPDEIRILDIPFDAPLLRIRSMPMRIRTQGFFSKKETKFFRSCLPQSRDLRPAPEYTAKL